MPTLSRLALDILNRSSEIKSDTEFYGETGGLSNEIRQFMGWLSYHLRSELQREGWEGPVWVHESGFYSTYTRPRGGCRPTNMWRSRFGGPICWRRDCQTYICTFQLRMYSCGAISY